MRSTSSNFIRTLDHSGDPRSNWAAVSKCFQTSQREIDIALMQEIRIVIGGDKFGRGLGSALPDLTTN